LADDWKYLFFSVTFYIGGGEDNFVFILDLSFDMEEAVKLEDLGFELGPFSIEEIGFLGLEGYALTG
jgi:hypothetical protein